MAALFEVANKLAGLHPREKDLALSQELYALHAFDRTLRADARKMLGAICMHCRHKADMFPVCGRGVPVAGE